MEIDSDNPLANAVRQEMAEAYFVACRKMVDALEALESFDRSGGSGVMGTEQSERKAELLEAAAERVYFVIIQREAMRLFGEEKFFDDYGVSDEVRKRLGPKRS